jgi:serine/threonine protein phosphatase PrpC
MPKCNVSTLSVTGREQDNQDRVLINRTIVPDASFDSYMFPLEMMIMDGTNVAQSGAFCSRFLSHTITKDTRPMSVSLVMDWNNQLLHQKTKLHVPSTDTTTLSVCLITDEKLSFYTIGDSRIYRYQNNSLTQLSHDQTSNNELFEQGLIEEHNLTKEKVVTVLLGLPLNKNDILHESIEEPIQIGDILIMMTDGISDVLSDPMMQSILNKQSDITTMSEELIASAVSLGATDNLSVIVMEVVE